MGKKTSELVNDYSRRLIESKYSQATADDIIREIDNLVFENNKKPLTFEIKVKIVQELKVSLRKLNESTRTFSKGGMFQFQSNEEYLKMVEYILSHLKR